MNYLFNNNESNENIILIVSCGRRFEQLKSTINKLCEHNPQISNEIKKCWVLDDRSKSEDRKKRNEEREREMAEKKMETEMNKKRKLCQK